MNKLSRKDIAMLEVLAVTQESKDKLAEYIQQREKAAYAYKAFREAVTSGVGVAKGETPNELRAEVIAKAKSRYDDWLQEIYPMYIGYTSRVDIRCVEVKLFDCDKLKSKGIAKCSPHDVFNEHIGKTIALGRALGKDVSEFENAVQPTEPVVGHVVKGYEALGFYRQDRKFTLTSKKDCDSFYYPECNEYDTDSHNDFIYNWQIGDIIDDTNAIYKED